jgi:hypothetical protein
MRRFSSFVLAGFLGLAGSSLANAQTQPQPPPRNPNPNNSPEVARGYQQNQQQYYQRRENQPSTNQLNGPGSSHDYGNGNYDIRQSNQH